MVCVFAGLLRVMTPGWAWLFTLTGLVPAMLAPGSLLGGLGISPYVALDRLAIAIAVWLWRAPAERSTARSVAIGLAAGLCQWIRFGGALFIVAGVIAADGVAGWAAHDRRLIWRQVSAMALGAAAVQAALIAWAVTMLPWAMARDVLWPAYYVANYLWVTPGLRWPAWPSWHLVIAQYGPALAGAVCGAIAVWRARTSRAAPLVAFVLGAYLAGVLGLFRHVHHFRQYAWLLVTAGAYAAAVFPTRVRAALVVWAAPTLAVMLHALFAAPAPGVWRSTPAAGPLYLSESVSERVDALNTLADVAARHGRTLLAGPDASGWYGVFGRQTPSRHTWFLAGVVRPWEAERVSAELTAAYGVAICPARDESFGGLNLPADLTRALARTFPRIERVGPDCAVHLRDRADPPGGR